MNSLVGVLAGDLAGNNGITALSNGNYVVSTGNWGTNRGAVTLGNGATGTVGTITTANSLVGTVTGGTGAGDRVGITGVTALAGNGNYVVRSASWTGDAGAVTWRSGTDMTGAVVGPSNSLVGSAGDQIGVSGVEALSNGNYVVRSSNWTGARGAVTWGSGTAGVSGAVTASNSLVGSSALDNVGALALTLLSNGNYVVRSPDWEGGKGAVTWGSGTAGVSGSITASNSLVGTATTDKVGGTGVTALTNGHYVVASTTWDDNRGAATWGNGLTGGTVGAVSASNSLVGTAQGVNGDRVGTGVTALSNGHYAVRSSNWGTNRGAVTWGNGAAATTVGAVSTSNSLVGTATGTGTNGDRVGSNGITALSNGNYVVRSSNWGSYMGAVTWRGGTDATGAVVSASNSLVGTNPGATSLQGDRLGNGGVLALSNGNYVVRSSNWGGNFGAVTWGNGTTGATVGGVSSSNSLVGSTSTDRLGQLANSVVELSSGNYIVSSRDWTNPGGATGAGAVTWGSGTAGVSGVISSSNSLIGTSASAALAFKTAGDTSDVVIAGSAGESTSGRVYVGLGDLNALTFGRAMAQDVTIRSDAITRQLNAGSALTLQASNDITVNSAITVNNPSGNGGHLTLQAGRSIIVNAAITTDNGNLTLIGNDRLANGVVDAQRDPGAGTITLYAPINAGTGTVDIQLRDGAGKTNYGGGYVSLGAITAGRVNVVNDTPSGVVLSGIITASGSGDSIVIAANRSFQNLVGANALNAAGRWLVYAIGPGVNTFGNLDSGNSAVWNASYATLPPASVAQTGNRYLFAHQPTLTFTSTGLAKTYGDDVTPALASAYTVSGLNAGVANAYLGDTLGSVVSGSANLSSAGAATTAGVAGSPYAITIAQGSLSASTGYALAFSSTGQLTVAPRAVTVTADAGQGKVYGNVDPTLSYAVTAGSLVGGDSLSGSLGRAAGENVGSYAINQGTLTNPNYTVSFVGSTFGITPRAVTVTATAGQNKAYGDADPLLAYTVTAGGLAFADTFSGSQSRVAGENIGNYAINQGTLALSSNYTLSYAGGVNFGITPRPVTVSATAGQGKAYGDADPVLTYAITAGSLLVGDSFSGALGRAAGENVGSYAINQGSLALNANYTLSYASSNFGITPRPVTVTASSGQSKVYGNVDPTLTYTVTAGSLLVGDSFSGSLSRAAGENVGSYGINQGSLALNANYTLNYAGGTAFAITPRPVTVTASSGQSKVYGNVDPALTYSVGGSGLAFADTLSGSLSRAAGENVGSYAINQGTLALNANYALTYVGSTFGVTPRAVTVSATAGQTKVYGDADPTLTYAVTAGSLLGGDSISGSLGRAVGEDVGSYAINRGTLANPNYTVSVVGSNFGITPRAVTVSATAGQSKIYGDVDPALAYAVTAGSLVGGDSLSGALGRAAGENVGSYAINLGTLANPNYTVSFVGSNFGITPRAVTVSATAGQSKAYGDADPTLAYTVTAGSLVFADGFSGALSRAAGENVGSYAVNQGTLALSANYTLSYAGGTIFGITPRPVTVTATAGQGKAYGDADPALTYMVTAGSLLAGDSFSGAISRAAGENVGSYAIGQGTLALNTNYTLSYAGSTFGITPRQVTVTAASGQGKVYGSADPTLTYTVTAGSLLGSDSFSGSLSRATGENVGNYAIGQGTLALNANYALRYAGTTFGITPRPLTVAATAGQGKVHGDVDPALTYAVTVGSLVRADAFLGSLNRAAGETVGSYPIEQGTLSLGPNYLMSYVGATFGITPRPTPSNPETSPQPSLPPLSLLALFPPMNNIWSVIAEQPTWFGSQAGEVLGPSSGYVETQPRGAFRICNPAAITLELIASGRVQLSGSDTACGL
nr:MBG domain-containing protein [Bosea sp. WAO]